MNRKTNKSIIISITCLIIVTLLIAGLTYAYYRTRIIENTSEDPSISVSFKNLVIEYSDESPRLNMKGLISPGFEYTKTFYVENTGSETINYLVYLEDIVNEYIRTQDWIYSVTCVDNKGNTCNGVEETEYPQLSEKIIDTSISSKEKHKYTLEIKYVNSIEDQSDDMRKRLTGKIQIYLPEYVVDIEGTVANAEDGDYVQINSVEKKSQIVDGKYRLPAIEEGSHTLTVRNSDGKEKGFNNLFINMGTASEGYISGGMPRITIDEYSANVILDITINEILETNIIEITSALWENPKKGTLLYLLKNNQPNGTETTVPGLEASAKNEARLLSTWDNYGTSHIYRGNVTNNYVNYSGMCWRVVRIQGNETINLTLADENHECNENEYSINNTTSAFANNNLKTKYAAVDDVTGLYFRNSLIPNLLETWANNVSLDMSKLVNNEWCDDLDYSPNVGYPKHRDDIASSLKCNLDFKNEIGILSASEVYFAGAKKYTYSSTDNLVNCNYFLQTNASDYYWTLSAYDHITACDGHCIEPDNWYAWHHNVFSVRPDGKLNEESSSNSLSIRPVIVLSSNVLANIDENSEFAPGTYQNPYVIN